MTIQTSEPPQIVSVWRLYQRYSDGSATYETEEVFEGGCEQTCRMTVTADGQIRHESLIIGFCHECWMADVSREKADVSQEKDYQPGGKWYRPAGCDRRKCVYRDHPMPYRVAGVSAPPGPVSETGKDANVQELYRVTPSPREAVEAPAPAPEAVPEAMPAAMPEAPVVELPPVPEAPLEVIQAAAWLATKVWTSGNMPRAQLAPSGIPAAAIDTYLGHAVAMRWLTVEGDRVCRGRVDPRPPEETQR